MGPGVSTRAGRGRSSPQCLRGAPGLVLPGTRAIAWFYGLTARPKKRGYLSLEQAREISFLSSMVGFQCVCARACVLTEQRHEDSESLCVCMLVGIGISTNDGRALNISFFPPEMDLSWAELSDKGLVSLGFLAVLLGNSENMARVDGTGLVRVLEGVLKAALKKGSSLNVCDNLHMRD